MGLDHHNALAHSDSSLHLQPRRWAPVKAWCVYDYDGRRKPDSPNDVFSNLVGRTTQRSLGQDRVVRHVLVCRAEQRFHPSTSLGVLPRMNGEYVLASINGGFKCAHAEV
jgi:hypothetical protein